MIFRVLELYVVSMFVLVLMCFSDYVFDSSAKTKQLATRLTLALVWPFAALSRKGRDVLFNNAEGI